ncbi:MAG: hypothetical protein DHS20C18_09120 [Saprospiraceae bacterium]|nr:MAG: hypothetical protein DHS20C18_09120 [Saprospiraceae bacterium]
MDIALFKRLGQLFALIIAAIIANYYTPAYVSGAFYIGTLIAYFRSENEAFWFTFYLVLADGFFGFFGLYEALLTVIPGLPPIEVSQLYILLSLFKAYLRPVTHRPFYTFPLQVLGIYIVFLLIQGHVLGVSTDMNVQFRIIKWLMPLFLFYSLPRLFTKTDHYRDLFVYLFPIAFVTLAAQIFTISTSLSPPQYFGIQKKVWFAIKVSESKTYRGFYNDSIVLFTYFAAFFFLAHKKKYFHPLYLFAVIAANFSSVFLSATRGWTISFSFMLIMSSIFVLQISGRRLAAIVVVGIVFAFGAQSLPIIGVQIQNSFKRMLTLEKLAEGDASAGGTLIRLTERGPRVMKKWEESPLTGWGFSNEFMDYNDFHVGNQNILLHGGIIGWIFIAWFIVFYFMKLFFRSVNLPRGHPAKQSLLAFIIGFMAWFLIHSSSQQLFSLYNYASFGLIQASFFCFSAIIYEESLNEASEEENPEEEQLDSISDQEKSLDQV